MLKMFKGSTPENLIELLNNKVFNQSKAESMLKSVDINHIDNEGRNFFHHAASNENVESIKWLSKYNLDINKEDGDGLTPLMYATRNGMINAIHALISKGADISYKNKYSRNALQEAILNGNSKGFDELYSKQKDKNILDTNGKNLLALAIKSNNPQILKKILELNTVKIDQKDNLGNPVLFEENCFLNIKILKLMIDHGVDINSMDEKGNSFLFKCITYGVKSKDCFEFLLESGANINIKNSKGQTILMEYLSNIKNFQEASAEYKKNVFETISLMIYYEVDLQAIDEDGNNVLFYALKLNEIDIIDLLLENDVDPNCINKNNETPLSITALQGYEKFRVTTSLVNAGALPNNKDSDGQTVIEKLIDYELYCHNGKKLPLKIKKQIKEDGNYLAILEIVLQNTDANLKMLNSRGEPYFFEAVFYGNLEIVKLLKTYGASINQNDKDQQNIIFRFMARHETFKNDQDKKKYLNLLKNIVPMGVNLNEKDTYGGTTLHKAILANDEQTIKILISSGADLNAIDHRGRNMIHNTIWKNQIKLFRLVYSYNAKLLNKPDKFGVLPINYAAFLGYDEMVLELLAAGSQVNNPYKKGKYILDFLEKFHDNLEKLEEKASTPIGKQKIRSLVRIMKEEFKIEPTT